MNQTVRFVKTCGKFEISAIFGALQNRIVPAINMIHIYENNIYIRENILVREHVPCIWKTWCAYDRGQRTH